MKITYNEREYEIEKGTRAVDVLKTEIALSDKLILACKFNNKVQSLNYELNEDGKLELVDYTNSDGKKIYIRGIMFVMMKALREIEPTSLLTVNYQLSNAMFCEIENLDVTDKLIKRLREKMSEIIHKDLEIKKVVMDYKAAEEFYKKENTIRGRLQLDTRVKDWITLYFCEDYYNYLFGVMPLTTGVTSVFEIQRYRDGFVVQYPSRKDVTKIQKLIDNPKLLNAQDEYEDIYKMLKINTINRLNRNVKKDGAKHAILLDEALHERKIAQLADRIAKNSKVKMVLIAGPSSSGKTTFAKRLGIQLQLNGIRPVTLSVDNYFVEREQNPKDENGEYNFECIEAIDLELFNNQLEELLKGEEVELPEFDFKVGTKRYNGNKVKLGKDEILVIEGIHCLNDKLTSAIPSAQKYKIYISDLAVLNIDYYNRISTTDVRLIRRIVRDYQFRGYEARNTIKMWNSVNKGEEKNIFPYQENADTVFNSAFIYELGALKNYAMPLLEKIEKDDETYPEARRLINLLKYFEPITIENIPRNSLLREFVGGSLFE